MVVSAPINVVVAISCPSCVIGFAGNHKGFSSFNTCSILEKCYLNFDNIYLFLLPKFFKSSLKYLSNTHFLNSGSRNLKS